MPHHLARPTLTLALAVAIAALGAQPAGAAQSQNPDYKDGIAQATYAAEGQSIYDPITFDAVAASVNRSAMELTLKTPDSQLLLLARYLIDLDPWAHLSLSVNNPFASDAEVRISLSIDADLDIRPAVPEPATGLLWLAGGLSLLAWARRDRGGRSSSAGAGR